MCCTGTPIYNEHFLANLFSTLSKQKGTDKWHGLLAASTRVLGGTKVSARFLNGSFKTIWNEKLEHFYTSFNFIIIFLNLVVIFDANGYFKTLHA